MESALDKIRTYINAEIPMHAEDENYLQGLCDEVEKEMNELRNK